MENNSLLSFIFQLLQTIGSVFAVLSFFRKK